MSNDYDVIIIGTGAGGGTLAHRLAARASASCCSSAAATCPASPRTGTRRRSSSTAATRRPRSGTTRTASPSTRRAVLRRRQHEGLRRDPLPPARVRLRRGSPPRRDLAGVAALLRRPRALLHGGREALLVHGQRGEDPTEPWASGPYPYPAVSHEPRIQQLHDDLARAGHRPFHLPVGRRPQRGGAREGQVRALQPLRRLPVPDRRQGRRARALRAPGTAPRQRDPADALQGRALETDAGGQTVTGRRRRAQGRARDLPRRRRRRLSRRRETRRRCSCARPPTSTPNGLANSSDVVGRHYMAHINTALIAVSKEPNPTRFQKTLGLNDYYYGADDFEHPLGHIQMLGKSDQNMLRAGAPWYAPGFALDWMARHAVDFWLTTEDLPQAENRVTWTARKHPRRLHEHQPRAPQAADREAQGPARPPGPARAPAPARADPRPADPDRRRRAPVRHRALRRGPGDVGPRRQLQGPRPRQPLRRRHELLPLVQRVVNPALTAMANALRVGDHLIERLGVSVDGKVDERVPVGA